MNCEKALFVTSFNKRLYEASGYKLIESYIETEQKYPLLVCYEENIELKNHPNIHSYNLVDDTILSDWLESNQDSIPIELGGTYAGKNPWNLRVSQWFRKVVSLNHAFNNYKRVEYILWLDCDCIFKNLFSNKFIRELFGNYSLLYLKGERTKFENGFIGFNNKKHGMEIFENFFNRYIKRTYKRDQDWDDCTQLENALQTVGSHYGLDIASKNSFFNGDGNNPFPKSKLRSHLEHWKGYHGRVLGIVPHYVGK
jgi:hypothetical protein